MKTYIDSIDDALDILDIKDMLEDALDEQGALHLDVVGYNLEAYLERKGMQHAELVEVMGLL